jgi:phosphoribosylanthranilate isomerase
VRVRTAGDFGAHVILLDAPHPGSGLVFDWAMAGELPSGQRLMIAGGLTPANVAAAIARTHPWGVDAVSGVESEPGRKDPIKLRDFIAAARAADIPAPVAESEEGSLYDWQEED